MTFYGLDFCSRKIRCDMYRGRERHVGCPAVTTRRRTRVIEHSGPAAVSDVNGLYVRSFRVVAGRF